MSVEPTTMRPGQDLEKAETNASLDSTSTVDHASSSDRPQLRHILTTQSRRSTASARQRRLDGTDPYENLEQCLSRHEGAHHYAVGSEGDADEETEDEDEAIDGAERIAQTRTGASAATSVASRPPDFEVIFEDGDRENPKNWPLWYRVWVLFCISFTCWIVVLFSTTYTASIEGIAEDFGTSSTIATLGLTTYLLGLAAGSVVLAPLSELYGRRPVYLGALSCWALLVIPSGLASNIINILVTRFFW